MGIWFVVLTSSGHSSGLSQESLAWVLCLPGDQSHPVCATNNKPSCVLQKKKKEKKRKSCLKKKN